ncbi:FAD-dependent oxidoreductase [Mesorhizobium sp. B3-1-3]|uniref:oxidoreductase n=1 Tax=unclassified Mesorhizobium TaxID=325217 RepID=UPI001125F188|nr:MULTISPECIES: FAD-dependent oxidoreductase [unclassified Mesorhizobium]TPI61479.1 FAD-dependent oxidoreductase [Mesorhizobium sp. B3-1-8]TPI70570.1 FAD-dependent oxidoreductase [Mesorhizobium sp. B3-1-3]
MRFPHLFSPFTIKGVTVPNRIFSTGHDTDLGHHGAPSDALVAYQRARAKGGAGLIIVQVVGVHETARYTSEVLMGTSDASIPQFKILFDTIKAEGTRAFVQLFHPGRELLGRRNGVAQAAYSASTSPAERFRIVPRALETEEVHEIIQGYGAAARRMKEAGAEGVEIVASHGYLPAQFLSPNINFREDEFGGSPEKRLRFLELVSDCVRRETGDDFIAGIRISSNEYDVAGFDDDSTLEICRSLRSRFDYFNVIAGTSASSSGAVHIAPPMSIKNAYLAPFAQKLKQTIQKPVFVAGRINQPHEAEEIVASSSADMCGMTRAMICDPKMPQKAKLGKTDDIRACIACNQACIGHAQLGLSISCIQYPESGRELQFGSRPKAAISKKVLVVGGGPGGMKAASVAAEIGHQVTLLEATSRLGGQAQLAQLLPRRSEFGGIITNLSREMELAGVEVRFNTTATAEAIVAHQPDIVILATGSERSLPRFEQGQGIDVVHAHEVISGKAKTGQRVVVYDWLADWIGLGVAEKLAVEGAYVQLAVNGVCPGISIQNYVRDAAIARLHTLGVTMTPFSRLFGAENRTVYLMHTASQEAVVVDDIDTLVVCSPNRPRDELARPLRALGIKTHLIGDALAPRTAEEAVFEGLNTATQLA